MKLLDYLTTRVPGDLDGSDRLRLATGAFLATAASVAVVHQFLPGQRRVALIVTHSLALAVTYAACIVLVSFVLHLLVKRAHLDRVEVWHLWALSFLTFNLGFFLDIPAGEGSRFALHPDVGSESPWLHYFRLVPIWMLLTHVFIQAQTGRALRAELVQLARLNEELGDTAQAPSGQRIHLVAGRTRLDLDADRVSHISVEDHYCYVHFEDQAGWRRTDVGLPLRDVLKQLPASFLMVHRSHVVNPVHLKRIERDGRSYRLHLTNDVVLPISKHRLNQVLPRVTRYLSRR